MNIREARRFYPTGVQIAELLLFDVQLGSEAIDREYLETPPQRKRITSERDPTPEQPRSTRKHRATGGAGRTYASRYVGVSTHGARWYGVWRTPAGATKAGRMRPMTDEGEKWAAQDRARALGLEYIELRDGTRLPYRWKKTEDV